jgi:hypothetical protein
VHPCHNWHSLNDRNFTSATGEVRRQGLRSVSLEPDGRIEQDWIPLPPLNATTPEKNPILSWGMLEIQYAFTCRSF